MSYIPLKWRRVRVQSGKTVKKKKKFPLNSLRSLRSVRAPTSGPPDAAADVTRRKFFLLGSVFGLFKELHTLPALLQPSSPLPVSHVHHVSSSF